jgi:hypothetical protein
MLSENVAGQVLSDFVARVVLCLYWVLGRELNGGGGVRRLGVRAGRRSADPRGAGSRTQMDLIALSKSTILK